jgi:hypothetical protein
VSGRRFSEVNHARPHRLGQHGRRCGYRTREGTGAWRASDCERKSLDHSSARSSRRGRPRDAEGPWRRQRQQDHGAEHNTRSSPAAVKLLHRLGCTRQAGAAACVIAGPLSFSGPPEADRVPRPACGGKSAPGSAGLSPAASGVVRTNHRASFRIPRGRRSAPPR